MSTNNIENLIKQAKNELHSEIKFLLKILNQQNIVVINKILKEGFVGGSILINMIYKIKDVNSDIDIFTYYSENSVSNLKNSLYVSGIPYEDLTFIDQDEDGYNLDNGNISTIKFTVGKLNKKIVNIIFNDRLNNKNFSEITSRFDFRMCDWHYDYFENELYASNFCIDDLGKRELNFSNFYTNKLNDILENCVPEEILQTRKNLSKRVEKYRNKNIVMGEKFEMLYNKILNFDVKDN